MCNHSFSCSRITCSVDSRVLKAAPSLSSGRATVPLCRVGPANRGSLIKKEKMSSFVTWLNWGFCRNIRTVGPLLSPWTKSWDNKQAPNSRQLYFPGEVRVEGERSGQWVLASGAVFQPDASAAYWSPSNPGITFTFQPGITFTVPATLGHLAAVIPSEVTSPSRQNLPKWKTWEWGYCPWHWITQVWMCEFTDAQNCVPSEGSTFKDGTVVSWILGYGTHRHRGSTINYTWIFDSVRSHALHSCIVQRSNAHAISSRIPCSMKEKCFIYIGRGIWSFSLEWLVSTSPTVRWLACFWDEISHLSLQNLLVMLFGPGSEQFYFLVCLCIFTLLLWITP